MKLSKLKKMIHERRTRRSLYCTADYWNSKATAYDGSAISMWPNKILNAHYEREQMNLVKKLIPACQSLRVLDLGCGTGRISRWLAAQGAIVTGLDFSSVSIEIARKLSVGPNPAYEVASLYNLHDEDKYDLIFTWGVLTVACRDSEDLHQGLSCISRALKKGGTVCLLEPVHKGFLSRVLSMSIGDFLGLMADSGLIVRTVAPLYFWPIRLMLAYISWPAWLTTPLYHLGRWLIKWPGLNRLGDYWAVLAIREANPSQGFI